MYFQGVHSLISLNFPCIPDILWLIFLSYPCINQFIRAGTQKLGKGYINGENFEILRSTLLKNRSHKWPRTCSWNFCEILFCDKSKMIAISLAFSWQIAVFSKFLRIPDRVNTLISYQNCMIDQIKIGQKFLHNN